jgi:hypothetical protein
VNKVVQGKVAPAKGAEAKVDSAKAAKKQKIGALSVSSKISAHGNDVDGDSDNDGTEEADGNNDDGAEEDVAVNVQTPPEVVKPPSSMAAADVKEKAAAVTTVGKPDSLEDADLDSLGVSENDIEAAERDASMVDAEVDTTLNGTAVSLLQKSRWDGDYDDEYSMGIEDMVDDDMADHDGNHK